MPAVINTRHPHICTFPCSRLIIKKSLNNFLDADMACFMYSHYKTNETSPLKVTPEDIYMQDAAIFAATLGLSHPWQITSVSFAKDAKRMDISVEFSGGSVLSCPKCGKEGNSMCTETECWFHDDFFRYQTYLHARVPCPECTCCGAFQVERPWSRKGSRFTLIQ